MKKLCIIGMFLFAIISCSKKDTDMPVSDENYFPLKEGYFITYQVSDIRYDDFNQKVDTLNYFLKERIDSSFVDGEGRTQYKLKRFTRDSDTLPWSLKDVWSVYRDAYRAEKTEENEIFVKLSFPLRLGKTWDGNSRNSRSSETYEVLNYDLVEKFTESDIPQSKSGQIVRINQRNTVNLIQEIFAEEVYVRNIGLVEKHDVNLEKDVDGNITSGYRTAYYLDTLGVE